MVKISYDFNLKFSLFLIKIVDNKIMKKYKILNFMATIRS